MAASRNSSLRSPLNSCIDISEDDDTNVPAFGWMASYNQRALLVRVLCFDQDKGCRNAELKPSQIRNVKLITREESSNDGPGYKFYEHIVSEDDFFPFLSSQLNTFENSRIASEYWNNIITWIEKFGFKYERKGELFCWTSEQILKNEDTAENFSKLPLVQSQCVATFGAALKCDMKNGQAKRWMQKLIEAIIESTDELSANDVDCLVPTQHCNTNTIVEVVTGHLDNPITHMLFNASYPSTTASNQNHSSSSLESSVASETSSGDKKDRKSNIGSVIPDFCVVLGDFPGVFPLVVELKSTLEDSQGISQNVSQMLSKLFFQDVVFGLVVSPISYQLNIIMKNEGILNLIRTYPISFYTYQDDVFKLNVERIDSMCTFIFQVLKWACKSNCLLNTN